MKKLDRRRTKRWLWAIAFGMLVMPAVPIAIFLIQIGAAPDRQSIVQAASGIATFYGVSKIAAITGVFLMSSLVIARLLGWTVPKQRTGITGGLMALAVLAGLSLVPLKAPASVAAVPVLGDAASVLGAAELCAQRQDQSWTSMTASTTPLTDRAGRALMPAIR